MTEATAIRIEATAGRISDFVLTYGRSFGLFVLFIGLHCMTPTTVSWGEVAGVGLILLGVELYAEGDR
jgi:hypothetical protein